MPYMPIAIFPMLVLGVISTAMLLSGAYLAYEWWHGAVLSTVTIAVGIAMLAVSALGRFVVLAFYRSDGDAPTWSREVETVQVERHDGTILHVELCGPRSGSAVILVHGWGCDNRAFYYTKRALSDKHRVLAWDLRGLGLSSRAGRKDYSLDAMADDLAAVAELADGQVVVIGHSIGGMIAQVFARRAAHRFVTDVAAMVLVSTTYTNPLCTTLAAKLMRALQVPVFTPLMYLTIGLSPIFWAMNWLSYLNGSQILATALTGFAGTQTGKQLDFASRFFVKASPAVLARGMLAMFKFDETSSIGNISCPVLVVSGDRDPVLLPGASEHIADALADGRLSVINRSKHMALIEHYDSFNTTLDAFIEASIRRVSLHREAKSQQPADSASERALPVRVVRKG